MTIEELRQRCQQAKAVQSPIITIELPRKLYKNTHEVFPGVRGRVVYRGGGPGLPARVEVYVHDVERALA